MAILLYVKLPYRTSWLLSSGIVLLFGVSLVGCSLLGCMVLLVINPAGPAHTVFTVTGTSTAGLNSTVKFSITVDPTDWIRLDSLLVIITIAIVEDESED